MSRVPNLGSRREFYIYQLVRLTDAKVEDLQKLDTNKLQEMELAYYQNKYGWTSKEYVPSTL